jgi:transposase
MVGDAVHATATALALAGFVHVVKKGTQSTWLVEILTPHVAQIVVAHVAESRGPKDDARDAYALAERLRTNALGTTVYKQTGEFATLRQLARTHATVVQDTVRVQSRLRALFRSRGVTASKAIYAKRHRETWLAKLPASSRGAAELLYAQYDALSEVRARAVRELVAESHRHPIAETLETTPGLGEIRVAQLISVVITPERFRTRQQFWSYCGLGIVMRSSSDWAKTSDGKWARAQVQKTRGLNFKHNHTLKCVFKGAATSVLVQHRDDPLYGDYERMLQNGIKPNLAKVTLARKLAAMTLAMWKRKEAYDPGRHRKPSS